jgi:hypothetical protein
LQCPETFLSISEFYWTKFIIMLFVLLAGEGDQKIENGRQRESLSDISSTFGTTGKATVLEEPSPNLYPINMFLKILRTILMCIEKSSFNLLSSHS